MFCKFCGNQVNDNDKFCSNCGHEINPVETKIVVKERGPWKAFAIVGYVLGIVSICGCVIPGFGISFGVYGIVFASLGKKSLSANAKATTGLTLSIIAVAINFVIVFIFGLFGN